ncbi:hypothetical protein M434DRAFT_379129 [Hypoxylon sp. CO27-5]|nr:hypothetical protein M434DRAFT_379129 [Hypoxylon sp. CO27-5]
MDSLGNSDYANLVKGQGHLTFPPTDPIQDIAKMSSHTSAYLAFSNYPQPPNPSQPPLDQMMETSTGRFQGWIRNIDDFHQVNHQYLQILDRPRGNCSDFPLDPNEQLQLVKALFEAAQDCSQIYEPEDSQSVTRIQQNIDTDVEFELVLWPLLMSTRDAQVGKCNLPNYVCCGKLPYNSYDSFMERFNAVHTALKSSKDVVISLFKDDTFKHRLAWKPEMELNQKITNRKVNGKRDVQTTIGARIARENGIKANQNGELVDRNGQLYGNVKKRSAAFEEKVSKSKVRGRGAKRTKLDSKATVQSDLEEAVDAGTIPKGFDTNHQEVVNRGNQPMPNPTGLTESQTQRLPSLPAGYAPNNIVGTPASTLFNNPGIYHNQSSGPFMGTGHVGSPNDGHSFYQTPTSGTSGTVAGSSVGCFTPQTSNGLDRLGQFQATGNSFSSRPTPATLSSQLFQPLVQPSSSSFDLIPHTQATTPYQGHDRTGAGYYRL